MAAAVPTVPLRKGFRIDVRRPHDRVVERDRVSRWANLLGTTALVILAPTVLLTWWGHLIGPSSSKIGMLIGLGIGGYFASYVLRRLLVSNPEWGAYVTLNSYKGENIPYGPGYHPTYWWEERNKDGNFSLEVVTKVFTISVPTKDAKLEATIMFEYQVDLAQILNHIGIGESTIDEGFIGFIQSFLTVQLADKTAEEGRTLVAYFNDKLADEFLGAELPTGETVTSFEEKNGIRAVAAIIQGLKFSEGVQQTRDSVDKGKVMFGIVASMLGLTEAELRAKRAGTPPEISDKQYDAFMDKALAISGNADMKVVSGSVSGALTDTLFSGGGKGRAK